MEDYRTVAPDHQIYRYCVADVVRRAGRRRQGTLRRASPEGGGRGGATNLRPGLAEHSRLPAKLAELTAAVAENLELHMEALDLSDENAAREHAAYERLENEHRTMAAQAMLDEMRRARDRGSSP